MTTHEPNDRTAAARRPIIELGRRSNFAQLHLDTDDGLASSVASLTQEERDRIGKAIADVDSIVRRMRDMIRGGFPELMATDEVAPLVTVFAAASPETGEYCHLSYWGEVVFDDGTARRMDFSDLREVLDFESETVPHDYRVMVDLETGRFTYGRPTTTHDPTA